MLMECFKEHRLVRWHVMNGLHLAVLVSEEVTGYVELERKEKMRAGFGGCVGNKGAISIEMSFMGQPLQVINCHLAAHQGESSHRNETIDRILN